MGFKEYLRSRSQKGFALWDMGKAMSNGSSRGQINTILTVGLIMLVAIIVIVVGDTFLDAIGTISNSNLNTSKDSIVSGFSSAMDLVQPLMIILVAVVIIGAVFNLQQQA